MANDMDDYLEGFQTISKESSRRTMPSPERMVFAAQRAKLLYGGYHRLNPHDPETYVMAVTAVLAHFEDDVIREVTDPLIGIATKEKFRDWPPNAGQLKAYCDEVQAYRARIADYSKRPRLRLVGKPNPGDTVVPPPKLPGRRANLLVPRGVPGYERMVERAKTGDPAEWKWHERGIMVALNWWQS